MTESIVKNLNFGDEARNKVFNGIDKLAKAVSSTLGAGGKCVMLEDSTGKPIITKDGVTVADSIILLDPVENMGSTLLKEAARKTVMEAGDGTTTATVLAHAILKEAYKVSDKKNAREIKDGINSATEKIIAQLKKMAVEVKGDMIDQIATISTNNDAELGKIIADAFRSVDNTGIVMMETSDNGETKSELIEGVQYDKGLTNSHFITNQKTKTAELDNPLVLLLESPVETIRQIQTVLEYVIKNNKPLLIIGDLEQGVLSTLATNKKRGNIKINVINAPTYGVSKKEMLEDLAMLTGANIINEDLGDDMDLISVDDLGSCLKSITSHSDTVIEVADSTDEVKEIIEDLKNKLSNDALKSWEVVKLEKRLAMLSAKIAVVKVGANSELELKEKMDRVEDAICATKAAIKEGIVPGGGIALLNASKNVSAKTEGEEALIEAVKAPFKTILRNAGIESYEQPKIKNRGLNVVTGKTVNMINSGIIDPLMVTKSALTNAASVATTILSTDCVINNLRINEGDR